MKRILWLIAAMVLLCGCTAPVQEETAPPPQTAPVETTAPVLDGIYVPGSDLETVFDGAVRYYLPPEPDVCGMRLISGDVLVFSGTGATTLTRYAGETLYPAGQITLDCHIDWKHPSLHISEYGVTYFDPGANMLVYLDNDLKEVSRLALPGNLVGTPVLSPDRTLVYYCTSDAVRVYDTASGLDKLLKNISYPGQSVENVLMDGTVLQCSLTEADGSKFDIYLCADTGSLIGQTDSDMTVVSQDDFWCAQREDGLLQQVLFGQQDRDIQALYPAEPFATPWILSDAVVTGSEQKDTLVLELYELRSGLCTAALPLPGTIQLRHAAKDPGENAVWLLAFDENADIPVLLLWNLENTKTGNTTVYTGPRYTAESPDTAGLTECEVRADVIGERYGLKILVGPAAAAVQPGDYNLEYEYQVPVISRELAVLEELLARFPQGFLEQLHGQTSICILRSITGNPATGSIERAGGIQFWDGEQAYVALEAGDSLGQSFFHEIFHIIDSKVLSTTRAYYHWENLNPAGCKYFQDYTSYRTADVSQYLQEDTRAFIDAYSMSYPREDRARIMEYACMEGNARYFQSEVMQNKLKTLCKGIREAFGLESYPEPLLWEQYLAEPLKTK